MKIRILSIIVLLFIGSSSFGQMMVNADNVINGVTNKWLPNALGYYQAIQVPLEGTIPGPGQPIMMSINGSLFQIQFCNIYAAQCQTLYADGSGGAVLAGNQSYSQLRLLNTDGSGILALGNSGASSIQGTSAGDTGIYGNNINAITKSGAFFSIYDLAGNTQIAFGNRINPTAVINSDTSANVEWLTNSLYIQTSPTFGMTLRDALTGGIGNFYIGDSYVKAQSDSAIHVPDLKLDSSSPNSLLYVDSSNLVKSIAPSPNQVVMGDSSGAPVATTLTAGTNITLDNSISGVLTFNVDATTVTATAPLVSTSVTGGYNISCGPGQCGVYDSGGNQFFTGQYIRLGDITNTYISTIHQTQYGLTFQPTTPGLGISIVDSTNIYGTDLIQDSTKFTISSKNGTGINLETNGSPLFLSSVPLTQGQFITANSSGVPITGNFVEGNGISISNDGIGNTRFDVINSPISKTVICDFNAGSGAGVTDVSIPFIFTKVGTNVTVAMPPFGAIFSSGVILNTDNSAKPHCAADFAPPQFSGSFVITNSNNIANSTPGYININTNGDIFVSYQYTGGAQFPSGVYGGLGFSSSDTSNQTFTYSLVPKSFIVSGSGTNGTVTPTPQSWTPGTTASLTFNLNPNTGYIIGSASDNCNSGSSGGSIVGSDYVVTTVNQNCTISATFVTEPTGTYTVIAFGAGAGTIPESANWITGTTTELNFIVDRFPGNQLSTISDNCNAGSSGGSLIGNVYKITSVTSNCTITVTGNKYLKMSYVDFTASGSLAVIPASSYAIPNLIAFGFSAPSANSLTSSQLSAVVTAMANESAGAQNFLSIGGATYGYSDFTAVGFSTVISNVLSIVSQINGAASKTINGIDLDLEGPGWNPTDIQTLITGFHGAGLLVSCTPQLYYTGSNNVNPVSPTNLILTSGGGTGNTFGTAASTGNCDYIVAQTYNSGGWTIGNAGEGTAEFFEKAAQALSNTIRTTCSGPTPLCIKAGTQILIGNVANAGAGGGGPGAPTIFNPTAAQIYPYPPNSIPAYNQNSILASYSGYVTSALTNYPAISGMMMWSHNNDYAPLLYQATDSATAGNFTNTIYGVNL